MHAITFDDINANNQMPAITMEMHVAWNNSNPEMKTNYNHMSLCLETYLKKRLTIMFCVVLLKLI